MPGTERFTITHRAGENDRFAADAFASSLGKTIPVTREGGVRTHGILCSAVVAEDGKSVALTLEVAHQGESILGLRHRPFGATSIGFNLGSGK